MAFLLLRFWLCLTSAQGWWCQASPGSCSGQRHKLQEVETPILSGENYGGLNSFRLADWDDDGDIDVLMLDDAQSLWFYERFPDDHFQKHELMKFPAGFRGFEVADWDGDRNLDLLLCHVPENLTGLASSVPLTVRFVNRSFLPATDTISFYEHLALLHTVGNTSVCRMQAVDFDNDGDLDLLMGNRHGIVRSTSMPRYFERRPTGLEERTGQQNPFSELSGSGVMQVADLDGDGGLDALAGFPRYVRLAPEVCGWLLMLYFRRTAAGSRANPPGGPMKMEFSCPHHDPGLLGLDMEPRVVDWNSDGLPDVIRMVPLDASEDGWKHSGGKWHLSLSQHFVDGELRRDSQVYRGLEMLKMLYFHYFTVVDDGFEDHIVILQSDDIDGQHIPLLVIKSLGGWSFSQRRVTYSYSLPKFHRFASEVFILVDWDRDGDLELLVPWVREGQGYFLAMSGLGENISDPFKNIKLKHRDKPLVVDWDNDGDLDLFLAPPDGRYFEQLADGSLYEWPSEQSPLVSAMKSLPPSSRRRGQYFQFVDCDKDGDEDLIYVSDDLALACEQDDETREFRCEADFLCLGADLNQYQGKRDRGRFEISALGGQLKLFAQQTDSGGIEVWTPGFCLPKNPCHEKGQCLPGHTHCSCLPGYEAVDCSKCQPHYFTAGERSGWFLFQINDCKACPGDGKVCYGRGTCFDDETARSLGQTWMPRGNGSCNCNEASFYGTDDDGRTTCMDGMCPAGTEEIDGHCRLCGSGSFSVAGGICKECPAGKFSLKGSSNCSRCSEGRISKTSGSPVCEACPAGTYEIDRLFCRSCPSGTISGTSSGSCRPCDAGRAAKESLTCEQCPGGFFAGPGSNACQSCPLGQVSLPNSAACRSCNGFILRAVPDATKQTCHIFAMDIILAAVCWMAMTCFCFLSLAGFFGRLPISDISSQGEKMVITTSIGHFFLKGSHPVCFSGTGLPDLDGSKLTQWRVKAFNSYQFTLHGEASMPLETSAGHLRLKFPHPFLATGIWRCPLIGWCLFCAAATGGVASQLSLSLTLLISASGIGSAFLIFAFRRRRSESTPLVKRRGQFRTEWPLPLAQCARGPERSMAAGKFLEFLRFFETFVKDRNMYYVCSNIVKPLTEPFQMSFAEMVGPANIRWFVSHYWGMPVRHFGDAIRKHAQSYEASWQDSAYWICTFSNSQWHVKEELGNGNWQESSFYLALRSPHCKGTTMVIDELVLPLRRIWCLFEVYQTILLSRNDAFEGLLLCTSSGVLQQGNAGTDVAVAVANTVANLDTRTAEASNQSDRLMIQSLIESMPGGFDKMNSFVRETICKALDASHLHYETTRQNLMQTLSSTVAPPPPGPTLLTSRAPQTEAKAECTTQ